MRCSVKGCKNKAVCWKDTKGFCDEHNPFSKKKLKNHNKTLMQEVKEPSVLDLIMGRCEKSDFEK